MFNGISEAARPGRASSELREVKGLTLEVESIYQDSTVPSSGQATTDNILGVDFPYTPVFDKGESLTADLVSELAIYFRSVNGGVGVNRALIVKTTV